MRWSLWESLTWRLSLLRFYLMATLRRLEVARAIATDPELMLLDEPFGGLNPAETELVARSIKRLHKGWTFRQAT